MKRSKACGFVIFDENNRKYYDRFIKSLRKFHSEEELPIFIWDENKIKSYNDPDFFYRAKPIIGRQLLKDYELVIGFDVDQVVCGDLNHIINDINYDIAAPLNWNRVDPPVYGQVSVDVLPPVMYLNCGLVAMRSREAVEHWFKLCHNGLLFYSHRYREQDLLNLMMMYCNYFIKNLDTENTWNGLISKGEMLKFEVKNNQLICPPSPDKFPDKEMVVKVIHLAGGNTTQDKFDYLNTHCKPEVLDFLKGLYEDK